uniref:hypothetical protein n=1 Tax=Acetatifactor sp. TaxID=1872090 RepID=UPI0040576411
MVNKIKEQMSDAKTWVLNGIIILLAIVMIASLWMLIEEFQYAFTSYYNTESSFVYAMEAEDYGRVVSMYHDNVQNGYEDKKDLQEYYGVAKYYEAAFLYHMYAEVGDTIRADIQKSAMEEAALQMGDFAFLRSQIDEKLGLK